MVNYQAHVTDEWERDTTVVQVRRLAYNDTTQAVAYLAEDRDGMATLQWHNLNPERHGQEHLVPTPGIRLPHDVAVAMARAILTEAGKDADEVERLRGNLEKAHAAIDAVERQAAEHRARADDLQHRMDLLERLNQTLEAAADREARTADHFHESLEHARRDERHEQDRRLHPSRTVEAPALDPDGPVAKAARSISDAFRGVNVSRSDLGL